MNNERRNHHTFFVATLILMTLSAGSISILRCSDLRAGYLYVLDSAKRAPNGQVIVIDLSSNTVARTFETAHMPDMAVSFDGRHLYITASKWDDSSHVWTGSLETYDTASGNRVASVESADELLYTGEEYCTRMLLSPSGAYIYILKNHQTVSNDEYYMAVYDTERNRFLDYRAELPGCRQAVFTPGPSELTVDVSCIDNQNIIRVAIDRNGNGASESRVFLRNSGEHFINIGTTVEDAETGMPKVILRDGRALALHPEASVGRAEVKSVRKLNAQPLTGRWVRMQSALVGRKQGSTFFGTQQLEAKKWGSDLFDQIVKADSGTLTTAARVDTLLPFYTMTLGLDGETIYTVSPSFSTVSIIDARTLRQKGQILHVGKSPILAISAPAPGAFAQQ